MERSAHGRAEQTGGKRLAPLVMARRILPGRSIYNEQIREEKQRRKEI